MIQDLDVPDLMCFDYPVPVPQVATPVPRIIPPLVRPDEELAGWVLEELLPWNRVELVGVQQDFTGAGA